MHRWRSLATAVGIVWLTASGEAQRDNTLRSYYVQLTAEHGDVIVSVEPLGRDVRIRVIEVARADDRCWEQQLVQAIERVLPRTTVQAVAGTPFCRLQPGTISAAVGRAEHHGTYHDLRGEAHNVVAQCGGRERVFGFGQPPVINQVLLERDAPDVAALWSAGERAMARVDPRPRWELFSRGTPEERKAREALGTALLPEIVSGQFQSAVGAFRCFETAAQQFVPCAPNYFAWKLRGYSGPPTQRGPLPIDVVEKNSLQFAHYVAPEMPAIAESARVFGIVKLHLTVDPPTGEVVSASAAVEQSTAPPSSYALLSQPAIATAKSWRFVPGTTPEGPFSVTIPYRWRCS